MGTDPVVLFAVLLFIVGIVMVVVGLLGKRNGVDFPYQDIPILVETFGVDRNIASHFNTVLEDKLYSLKMQPLSYSSIDIHPGHKPSLRIDCHIEASIVQNIYHLIVWIYLDDSKIGGATLHGSQNDLLHKSTKILSKSLKSIA